MGSFRAHLELGGTKFDVLFSEYTFSRSTDKKEKVSSNVIGTLKNSQKRSEQFLYSFFCVGNCLLFE